MASTGLKESKDHGVAGLAEVQALSSQDLVPGPSFAVSWIVVSDRGVGAKPDR